MTANKNMPRTGQSQDSKVKRISKRRAKRQASPFQRIKLGVSASAYVPSEHMQQMQQSLTLKEVMNHAHRFEDQPTQSTNT